MSEQENRPSNRGKEIELSVGFTSSENEVSLEPLRDRLHKMKDTELVRFIRAAEYMCSPHANFGKPSRVYARLTPPSRPEL